LGGQIDGYGRQMTEPRTEQTLVGDERTQLQAFLDDNRAELAGLLDGLTDEQARRRLVASRTTLAGIVKHCTFVEKAWFQVSLAGRTRAELGLPEDADESWLPDDADSVESLVGDFRQACAESDEIARRYDLDDLAQHNRRGPLTVRWIYAHMIEELARHAGHGDILREQVLHAP
jgi:hypothetical protein